jgi:hypothetical protein
LNNHSTTVLQPGVRFTESKQGAKNDSLERLATTDHSASKVGRKPLQKFISICTVSRKTNMIAGDYRISLFAQPKQIAACQEGEQSRHRYMNGELAVSQTEN